MPLNFHDLQYISVTLYAVVTITTIYRIHLRYRTRLWYWDDLFALIGTSCMTLFIVGVFLLGSQVNPVIKARYPIVLGYYIPIWSARLSILFTIARFIPHAKKRSIISGVTGIFILQWALLLTQAIQTLGTWESLGKNQPKAMSITQILTTVPSDVLLILLPIWIIRTAKLSSGLRSRLLAVFSMSIVTALAGIAHTVVFSVAGGFPSLICGIVEVFAALLVCNAFVVILVFTVSGSDLHLSIRDETVLSTVVNL